MIQIGNLVEQSRDSYSSPKSIIPHHLKTMDLTTPTYLKPPSFFSSNKETIERRDNGFYRKNKETPFADDDDPLCKLTLKETSEFVKALPMTSTTSNKSTESSSRTFFESNCSVDSRRREEVVRSVEHKRLEAPPTPGRPVFSFSVGNLSRKNIPSKWDDAEKWLISSNNCHDSPAYSGHTHFNKPHYNSKVSKQNDVLQQKGDDDLAVVVASFHGSAVPLDQPGSAFNGSSAQVFLKDKFTDNVDPIFPNIRYSEPTKENFLFRNTSCQTMKDASTEVVPQNLVQVQHRDVGTEMTPLGSSTTSRCHTPFKSSSPARHNTPANISGPLAGGTFDISELKECHFAKLELGTQFDSVVSTWSSREEEEEEISKSLRHFEPDNGCRPKNIAAESRASAWEEEERTKSCIRYQREATRIQAWVNLQSAKAEAQSRKLEVKIQKMRSNLEEKLLKRMAMVNRKAEEMRAAAQLQHSQQIQRATEHAEKIKNQHNSYYHTSCGCFPCNNHPHHI